MKATYKKLLVVFTAFAMALSIVAVTPLSVSAKITYTNSKQKEKQTKSKSKKSKSKNYFKDVTSKKVYKKEIEWLAEKGAFKGIAKKGKKFKPNVIITRREFCTILDNLYGNRIDLTIDKPDTKVTQAFATSTLTTVSKQLGYRVVWKGGAPKGTVTRCKACLYIRQMQKSAKSGQLDPA